jgi:hypothetical protein
MGGHVAHMGEMKITYKRLVQKPEGKRTDGVLRLRWQNNIKMDLKEMDCEDVDWIKLAQESVQ